MKHARSDYDLIQDPRGKIPAAEPVFLVRGQDAKGQKLMKLWCELAEKDGSDPKLIALARGQINAFDEWQRKIKSKPSDLPAAPESIPGASPVKIGQEWESTDFRSKGQVIRIDLIQGVDAIVTTVVRLGGGAVNTQRQSRVPLNRFLPNARMGYKLHKDVK